MCWKHINLLSYEGNFALSKVVITPIMKAINGKSEKISATGWTIMKNGYSMDHFLLTKSKTNLPTVTHFLLSTWSETIVQFVVTFGGRTQAFVFCQSLVCYQKYFIIKNKHANCFLL